MSQEDYLIWQRWWPTKKSQALAVYFDVYLGAGRPSPPGTPENYARMWTLNNQRRADVIVETANGPWIIELRYLASPSAVGRLLVYRDLWLEDPGVPGPVTLWLISNERIPDVDMITKRLGITYEII